MSEEKKLAEGIFSIVDTGSCPGCVKLVEKSLRKIDGVKNIQINYITSKVHVMYDTSKVTPEMIRKAISRAGYKAFEENPSIQSMRRY